MTAAIAPSSFHYKVAHGVATLTLNRPARLNALTFEVYRELESTFRALATADDVRAVILTGAGRGFCAGGDVDEIIGPLVTSQPEAHKAFCRLTGDTVRAMRKLYKPIIAAINGVAAGGGAALALAADIRIAAPGARVGFVFPQVGLSAADMGVTWLLPRVVGLGRASELLFTGDIIDADAALDMGLWNRIVPADGLMDDAMTLARRLADGPAAAHATTKRVLDRASTLDLEAALAAEVGAQFPLMSSADFREAAQARSEGRPTRFAKG